MKTYATPAAFRTALEARIRAVATKRSLPIQRCRQRRLFEAFIARVFLEIGDDILVKGGVALELVFDRARATKDVDLRAVGDPTEIERRIRAAGLRRLLREDGAIAEDFLTFELGTAAPITNFTAPYGGTRYVVQAKLGGTAYGDVFGLDVGIADAVTGVIQTLQGNDIFDFVGIAPTSFRIYPPDTHVAEKLHAYSVPRDQPNSRMKDLPDIALLSTRSFDALTLRASIDATFAQRATHPVPNALAAPPPEWVERYAAVAARDSLPWPSLADVYARAGAFLDPVLSGRDGMWEPQEAIWNPRTN